MHELILINRKIHCVSDLLLAFRDLAHESLLNQPQEIAVLMDSDSPLIH